MADRDVYQQIVDVLSTRKRVLITTHVRPDGDALGTTAALWLGMKKAGVEAEVLLLSHLPTKYAFIYRDNGVVFHDVEPGWSAIGDARKFFDRFDALLVADTGTSSQLPGLREQMDATGFLARVPKVVLYHHLTQEDWADHKLVITIAPAAAEVAFELLEQWPVA